MLTPEEKWFEIYRGLAAREFGPLDGAECNRGKCHTPDEKHYVLVTDGLVIYSTIPHHDQTEYVPGSLSKRFFGDEFDFDEFDDVMSCGKAENPRQARLEQIWERLWNLRNCIWPNVNEFRSKLVEEMDELDPSGMGLLGSLRGEW